MVEPKILYGPLPIEFFDGESVLCDDRNIFSWFSDCNLGLNPKNYLVLSLMLSNTDFSEGEFSVFRC